MSQGLGTGPEGLTRCDGRVATVDASGVTYTVGFYPEGKVVELTHPEMVAVGLLLGRLAHGRTDFQEGCMTQEDAGLDHAHETVEIADSESITAYEQLPHGIITLRFHKRGLSLDLTDEEATILATMLGMVVEHVKA